MNAQTSLITTDDGSCTLQSLQFAETYHSTFGALSESRHIFIENGFSAWLSAHPANKTVTHIFEMGFGAGLNAILTLNEAERCQQAVCYHAIELYPLSQEHYELLRYEMLVQPALTEAVRRIQTCEWDCTVQISPYFSLHKQQVSLVDTVLSDNLYDIVFWDAFSPNVQPELWTEAVFSKLFCAMTQGACLSTYCAKGSVRRAMTVAGFDVIKKDGPSGKRHITTAWKR